MSDDYKATIAQNLTGSIPTLAVVLGGVFVLLGLAGGITYHQWLPFHDVLSRVLAGAFGVGLIAVGFHRSHRADAALKPRDFGIKIQFPTAGSRVNTVDVVGSIAKALPRGYGLRVFRVYPGSNNFVPLSKARIDEHAKTWVAERCHIGGVTGDQRFYAAYLCGPDAEVLVGFHSEAVAVHRRTMDAYEKAAGEKAEFLPSIAQRTSDMYECDRVSVVRS